ncbi:MAG: MFS transporter [Planctomycetota bacterium]
MPESKHLRVQANILLLVLGLGTMSGPLVGALRESVQEQAALSRAELGLWIFAVGITASALGLVIGMLMRRTVRTTFVRIALFANCVGCLLLAAVHPAPGWALAPLAAGWFVLRLAKPMGGSSNAIFTDLWESSPHTGVILLHAVNSFGKVAAPLAVLFLGTAVRPTALLFAGLFGLLALDSLFWPAESLRHLRQVEQDREEGPRLRIPRSPAVWLCAAQFIFIVGAEGGATTILGSLVAERRPVPVDWIPAARWPATVLLIMLCGILVGRVVFALLSLRMRERSILGICTACAAFSVPAAFSGRPAVYLPCLFLMALCYSATWPAFFALAARAFPVERTFLSFSAMFFTSLGLWGGTFLTSAVGNVARRLPHALVAANALIVPFVLFLFLTPWGRALNGQEATAREAELEGERRDG